MCLVNSLVFDHDVAGGEKLSSKSNGGSKRELLLPRDGLGQIAAHTFAFRELAAATMNFHPDTFLGEGGFGRVYKGRLDSTGQVIFSFVLRKLHCITIFKVEYNCCYRILEGDFASYIKWVLSNNEKFSVSK